MKIEIEHQEAVYYDEFDTDSENWIIRVNEWSTIEYEIKDVLETVKKILEDPDYYENYKEPPQGPSIGHIGSRGNGNTYES